MFFPPQTPITPFRGRPPVTVPPALVLGEGKIVVRLCKVEKEWEDNKQDETRRSSPLLPHHKEDDNMVRSGELQRNVFSLGVEKEEGEEEEVPKGEENEEKKKRKKWLIIMRFNY